MKKLVIILVMVFGLVSLSWAGEFGVAMVYATDVEITMTVSEEADVAQFNIYRSDTSGEYDVTKLVGTPTESVFVETDVPDGTWFWVATYQDAAGNEGPMSNEVTATLDTTPPNTAPVISIRLL